jgi:hypothetical protein
MELLLIGGEEESAVVRVINGESDRSTWISVTEQGWKSRHIHTTADKETSE